MAKKIEKQAIAPPVESEKESLQEEVVAAEAQQPKRKKPTGFFAKIIYFFVAPFLMVYDRVILALKNTARRIKNGILFVLRPLWKWTKRAVVASAVLGVIAGGFYLGMYLHLFDMDDVNRTFLLWKWPVIGENFVEPPPLPEPEEVEEEEEKKEEKTISKVAEAKNTSVPIKITREDLEKQMKEAAKAEKKRAAKLARLYEGMKPQEAADIMNELEDNVIIAVLKRMDESSASKILTKLEPEKAARLTNIIYHDGSDLR